MGDKSKIEWTDATWNPVTGCSKVSAGCKNCYAERWANMHRGEFAKNHDRKFTEIILHPEKLEIPLRWKRPRKIFVNSMSDLFHEDVPSAFIADVFLIMQRCPQHIFQILTKRPERMQDEVKAWYNMMSHEPYKNVWLGVSVENQQTADERIPILLQTPAAIRFLSCEPLLAPIKLPHLEDNLPWYDIHWVIVGGESGPNFRPMNPDWARDIRDQCIAAGVPFLFKQWAGKQPKELGRELDGITHNAFPSPLPKGVSPDMSGQGVVQ